MRIRMAIREKNLPGKNVFRGGFSSRHFFRQGKNLLWQSGRADMFFKVLLGTLTYF